MREAFDVAVAGGGMVGSAIALGCAEAGARVALLDQGDIALRAARGNFGLVWSQGKGDEYPAYAAWTRASVERWGAFAVRMGEAAGAEVGLRQQGGVVFCLGEAEYEARAALVARLHNQPGGATGLRMLDRAALEELLPEAPLGPTVLGASFEPADGHVNPLMLLRGMHAAFRAAGGVHLPGGTITAIRSGPPFEIAREGGETIRAARVVIAAGLGTMRLAAMLGMEVPVRPVRGQNIVTERLPMMLRLPASALRQTVEGAVQIGVTNEEGQDAPVTSVTDLARMASRAVKVLPPLAGARMVRAWAAIRPMTPDGFPVYAQSAAHPGAFAAVCHSGVTLAAAHRGLLAPSILTGELPQIVADLGPGRFHARAA